LEKRILVLTGRPGVGKTTVLMKAVEALRTQGYGVGGVISLEVRCDGRRVGFQIEDLSNGEKGWLARAESGLGPRVGRYSVDIGDLERVGVAAIRRALTNSDLIAIDEIGPMELFSEKFRETVQKAFHSGKLVLAVVHQIVQDDLVVEAKNESHSEVLNVTAENRNQLPSEIASKAIAFLERCR
jgi:nucleoside-triphosphatase